ncbi:hypothetical protein EIP91_011300 [Steccherinum ochraceum]|uniref:Peptidase S9 prolyl oligopeptidase catalytic domain-containing protein n=1 Tax=Steccherinum ochraceum TaxID=92696 RepID=A0A4R0RIM0_9APHY|nr:hypothetical protein EIP91_011300 [Steccherinum ochraceum]
MFALALLQTALQLPNMSATIQADFSGASTWRVSVSNNWDVLGPFPIHAREQHFLSPSFPLNLSQSIDFEAKWPSAYADNGVVGWTQASSDGNGNVAVSFPEIRWTSLRATEGWAALQHHSVLRTSITVSPPQHGIESASTPRLLVSLAQGSFFTLRPTSNLDGSIPRWYTGNVYGMDAAPAQSIDFPVAPSVSGPTTYDVFVSGDYELRLFGDPAARNSEVPELQVSLQVEISEPEHRLILQGSHNVIPDFVDGWAFGRALGVGLRSSEGWWTVTNISVAPEFASALEFKLLHETRLAPTQTRIVPLHLTQNGPIVSEILELLITATSGDSSIEISVKLPVRQYDLWQQDTYSPLHATFFYATSMPTAFLVKPPASENGDKIFPPILAFHGAGVDVINMPFWVEAVPRQKNSWVIAPAGRTAWGLDWHGPSTKEAWGAVDALHDILEARSAWHPWRTEKNTRVLLIGHSNGGQGTWYAAGRFPDKIIGAIPAAGYIKSQSYVPLVQSRSAHFVDPALRAILETSLTPDDNDLFLSNLVDTTILAIHGGDDENVPVWHTRDLVGVLKAWRPDANVTYQEDKGKPHWYPDTIFDNDSVQRFLDSTLEQSFVSELNDIKSFTLTVAIPSDSGSLHGFHIDSLLIPGRLGRLTVEVNEGKVFVKTINIKAFSIAHEPDVLLAGKASIVVDGQDFDVTALRTQSAKHLLRKESQWEVVSRAAFSSTGRLLNILSSSTPIAIVIPDEPTVSENLAARRLAHDLDLYHKLDAYILHASEATSNDSNFSEGHLIVLGGKSNAFGAALLKTEKTAFSLHKEQLKLRGQAIDKQAAALFLHPHPANSSSLVLFMYSDSETGLERASRLFPIRTGITVPDWVIVGNEADVKGAGGVIGAGVWGHEWAWNEAVSSF